MILKSIIRNLDTHKTSDIALLELVGDNLHFLFHLFHLSHLTAVIFLILLDLIFLLLSLISFSFFLFQQGGFIRNPIIDFLLMLLPYIMLIDTEIILFFSTKIEEIVNIVKFIMCVFDVLLKTLQFEINLEALETADITI